MDSRSTITRTLLEIMKFHDPELYSHSLRVMEFSLQMAAYLKMSNNRKAVLYHNTLLHDIGKLAVDPQILNKPASLTFYEKKIIQNHVHLSVINRFWRFKRIVRVIKHHHEWYNGQGYPDGLHGKRIPLESRILAIADAFDAMMNERPYRGALNLSDAVAEIKNAQEPSLIPK